MHVIANLVLFVHSNASIPGVFLCLERGTHIDKRIAGLLIPFFNNFCKPSSALYQVISVMFAVQLANMPMGFANMLLVAYGISY